MTKVIIYTNENGNVSVCHPTGELSIEEVKAKDTPSNSIIVDVADIPTKDSDFFNAWRLNNGVVSVDLDAAKVITKDRLRQEREPLLQAQDVLFQRALETGTDTAAIVVEKQRLRNITTLADQATTLDELRSITL